MAGFGSSYCISGPAPTYPPVPPRVGVVAAAIQVLGPHMAQERADLAGLLAPRTRFLQYDYFLYGL